MKPKEIFQKYPVAICAATALVVFTALALFRGGFEDDLRSQLNSREVQASRIADNIHNGQRMPAQLEQMESMTKRIAERLSNPTDVASNQQYFYKLESDSGVKLVDLHQVAIAKIRNTKPKYSQYSTIAYSVTIQGDFTHIVSFLRNLENGSKLSAIVGAEIGVATKSKTEDDPGPSAVLQVSLNIQLLGVL